MKYYQQFIIELIGLFIVGGILGYVVLGGLEYKPQEIEVLK